jgi:hypothetical protein
MPKNDLSVTVENYQIVGDETLRVDLSFVGTIEQDGKELTLNHERQTMYVSKRKKPTFELRDVPQSDPRIGGKL